MKHQPLVAMWIVLAALLSQGSPAAAQGASPPATSPPAGNTVAPAASAPPNYIIGASDRLRITVWNQENISGEYSVSADGSFTFPLIGRVVAGGLTLVKLEAELKRLLADGYFKNPQVTAAVLEYRSKQIFVMGALRQPGAYPMTGDMTLVEALARAGSTTTEAADHAFIIRSSQCAGAGAAGPGRVCQRHASRPEGVQQRTAVLGCDGARRRHDFRSASLDGVRVRAGENPGAYPIGQETTVRQALSLAGGVSEFGAANRVRVLRVENGKEREIKVELNDIVKPGDTIVVPERFF